MTELVVDSSVVIKWFRSRNEHHVDEARELLAAYVAGTIDITVPAHLYLEVLNSFGRKWGADLSSLDQLLSRLNRLGFTTATVRHDDLPRWIAAGLTAYDAVYVAVAEARSAPLITADEQILAIASTVARHVHQWDSR